MPTMKPSSPRRYGDDEVQQLLERATQLQQAGEPEHPEDGVTLAELEEAAAEVGIQPRYIRRAAAFVGNRGARANSAISRVPGVSPHRLIQGEIGDEDWNSLIGELEHIMGEGTIKVTARSAGSFAGRCKSLQWHSANGGIWVHLTSKAGKTKLWAGDESAADKLVNVLGGSLAVLVPFFVARSMDAGFLGVVGAIMLGVLLILGVGVLRFNLMQPSVERSESLEGLAERIAHYAQPEYSRLGE